ncbi:MAG: AbrB family transcriptional regulator [Betaproteobacteria bacterium]|nr:MAG: AbrB family transcriptional regulator [Betaproteobacteria bacterium]
MTTHPAAWLPAAKGLAIGFAAALLCVAVHAPLPWMIGPLVAVAACRSAGIECAAPAGGRQAGQWVIGTALGLYFTPVVAGLVARMWWLLLFAALFALALGYFCGYLVARLAGIDKTTAVFASVPGGAAEMSVLGERYGARVDEVAAAQSLRLMLVVIVIPWVFAALNAHGVDAFQPGTTRVEGFGLAALLACTLAGGLVLQRLGVANAFVLGALAIAIPLTVAEVNLSAVPRWLTNVAQLLLGCALGARFERSFLRRAPRFVAAVVLSVGAAMAISAVFGVAMAEATGLHPATLVLATAPGGIAEMSITAKVLELGVPLVTAFHVSRVVILLTCTAPLFGWLRRRRRREG